MHIEKLPADLLKCVAALKRGRKIELNYKGIDFSKMEQVALAPLTDRRTKNIKLRRITKSFRFKPATIDTLNVLAQKNKKSETSIIEDLLDSAK